MLFTAPDTGGFLADFTKNTILYTGFTKKIRERRKLSLFGERG
jgi:hypothetical protein